MSAMRDYANTNTDFARPDDREGGFGGAAGDDDDDSAFLDDPVAVAAQRPAPADMPEIARPAHVPQDTHDLVRATMACGAAHGRARDAEVARFRAARLAELKRDAADPLVATAVDARAMLAAVADADAAAPVVVHVYSDDVAACRDVDRALALLAARARSRPADCAFAGASAPVIVRLDAAATRLDPAFGLEIDDAALPALLVYRARELVHHECNAALDDADAVEDFLEQACGR